MTVTSAEDRYLVWPALVALGIPTMHVVIRATPAGPDFLYVLVGMSLLAMIWAGFGLTGLVMTYRNATAGARKRAVSWLAVCMIVGTGMLQLDTVRRYTNLAGDTLHFAVMYSSYLKAIEKLPHDGEPKLVVFNFGGMVWASGGVVYDESDEIRKPQVDQSSAWKLRADRTELGCGYGFTPLIGHFYLADFPC